MHVNQNKAFHRRTYIKCFYFFVFLFLFKVFDLLSLFLDICREYTKVSMVIFSHLLQGALVNPASIRSIIDITSCGMTQEKL